MKINRATQVGLLMVLEVIAAGTWGCKKDSIPLADANLPSSEAAQILSWLPSNTETFIAASGPFSLPATTTNSAPQGNRRTEARDIKEYFQALALGPLSLNNGGLLKQLAGAQVQFAGEGSRAFRPPSDLGELLYEGCTIVIFKDDVTDRESAFMKDTTKSAVKIEQVANQKVAVFQEQMEGDTWTTFVAFPTNRVLVVATNEDYLREVLSRMSTSKSDRAFPQTLSEWRYVDTNAEFWGMRHFDKSQARLDPTSPFGGRNTANLPDDQAIGLTFQCDPAKELRAKLVYLSGDKANAAQIERLRFPAGSETESTAQLHIAYRELSPGIVESSYDLSQWRSFSWFFFVFMGNLGHAIYV